MHAAPPRARGGRHERREDPVGNVEVLRRDRGDQQVQGFLLLRGERRRSCVLRRIARELLENGTYGAMLADAIPCAEANGLFTRF